MGSGQERETEDEGLLLKKMLLVVALVPSCPPREEERYPQMGQIQSLHAGASWLR